MPVYNEETFNYEILLRFGDADPNKGKLTGASRTTITQTTKDGLPIAGGTNINPPEQLALVANEEGEMLSDVLGEVNAQTIVQHQMLLAVNQNLLKMNDEIAARNQDLVSGLELQQKKLDIAQSEIQRLTALLDLKASTTDPD